MKNNEKYEGQFSNNSVNGSGVYYFKDNRYWVGYYLDNEKERAGVLAYPDGKIEIVTYSANIYMGVTAIENEILKKFKENNQGISSKIQNIKEITRLNDILIIKNQEIVQKRKEDAEKNFEYVEDIDEKNRLLRLKRIKEFNPFMYEMIEKLKKDSDKNEYIYLRDDYRKAMYLGQINSNNAYEQCGGLRFDMEFCIDCCAFRKPEDVMKKKSVKKGKEKKTVKKTSKQRSTSLFKGTQTNSNTARVAFDLSKIQSSSGQTPISQDSQELKRREENNFTTAADMTSGNLQPNVNIADLEVQQAIEHNVEEEEFEYLCHEDHLRFRYLFASFVNDKIDGKALLYDENQKLIYKGSVEKELIPSGKGEKLYKCGDVYNGDFVKGKRHGNGTLQYASGDTLVGSFDNDLASGEGVMYEKDNPVPFTINFKGGVRVVEKPVFKPFIEKHKSALRQLYTLYPLLISTMITYFKPPPENDKLHYEHIKFESNIEYIGQVDDKGDMCGRGCMILDSDIDSDFMEKYYIGYFSENKRTKYGMYFDNSFTLLYEGEIDDNFKNGKGRDIIIGYGNYDGEFSQNKWHGKGLYFFGKSGRVEGNLANSYYDGKCKYIYDGMKLAEIIECQDGNVINSHEIIKLNSQQLSVISKQKEEYIAEYNDLIKKIESLPKTKDQVSFNFAKVNKKRGFYIGEVNFNMEAHGRGLYQYRKGTYHLGFWVNGCKEGFGKDYVDEYLTYEGNFRRDNKIGHGIYYNKGKKVYGCFSCDGSCDFVVTKNGKEYQVGRFQNNKYIGKVYLIKGKKTFVEFYDTYGKRLKNYFNIPKFINTCIPYYEEVTSYIKSFVYSQENKYYTNNSEIRIN